MTIVELIDQLKTIDLAEKLGQQFLPDVEYDSIDIYMKNQVGIESEIYLFDSGILDNNVHIEVEGIKYEHFFALFEAQEMVEALVTKQSANNIEMAKRMIEYSIYDA
ncbi:hypothetical protein ACTJJ0_12485 [Chitinophaga sp. 22321]|uniref:Uncharacterized protein n=1 Tax=Chitinophaga hostae TaxID=2831022 RepID=A0ABS5IWV8_9BACT|nr:hypothetical protein [Chitinophaga hostae]MBS0027276.1 hypothetical protein [Chitinophaga hostae]